MKSALPYMPWYPRDFLAATLGWSLLERGLYRALLDAQWEQGSLPCEKAALIRIAQATEAEFETAWPRVREKFKRKPDGTLINKKLEKHRHLAIKKHEERVKTGKAGAQKRWASHSSANSSANGKGNSKSIATKTKTNKEKSKNPPNTPPKRGGSNRGKYLPDDFVLTKEMREYAIANGVSDPESTFEDFRLYWKAASGARARKRDWVSTWQGWCRRAGRDEKGRSTKGVSAVERVRAATGHKL